MEPTWYETLLAVIGVIAAIGSAVAAIFAFSVSKAAFEWKKRQDAPYIHVSVRTIETEPQLIFLVIENRGPGPAYDIKFELEKPIPQKAWGFIEGRDDEQRLDSMKKLRDSIDDMDRGPLITGIPALASGDMRRILWGQFGGLYACLQDSFVRVTAEYKDSDKNSHESLSLLEVKSFEFTDAGDRDFTKQLAKSVDELTKYFKNGNFHRNSLIVESKEDHDRRMTEFRAAAKNRRAESS